MAARLTDEQRMLRAWTEAALQDRITSTARLLGWRWFHPADNIPITAKSGKRYVQNVRAGFPDLVMVRDTRLIFAELKKQFGVISPEQHQWLNDLARTYRAEVYLWRPSDLPEIARILDQRVLTASTHWASTWRPAA